MRNKTYKGKQELQTSCLTICKNWAALRINDLFPSLLQIFDNGVQLWNGYRPIVCQQVQQVHNLRRRRQKNPGWHCRLRGSCRLGLLAQTFNVLEKAASHQRNGILKWHVSVFCIVGESSCKKTVMEFIHMLKKKKILKCKDDYKQNTETARFLKLTDKRNKCLSRLLQYDFNVLLGNYFQKQQLYMK